MAAIASSDRVASRIFVESVFGVVPSGPATFEDLRLRSESLKQDTSTARPDELRSDRQDVETVRTETGVSGDMAFALSHESQGTLIEGVLQSTARSAEVTVGPISTISFDNATSEVRDSANGLAVFGAGEWMRISGSASNNVVRKIVSVLAGAVVLSRGTIVDESTGASITLDQLESVQNGTTFRSYTYEREYTDLTTDFANFTGLVPGTMSLEVNPGGFIVGTFGFVAQDENSATATVGDGSPTAVNTNQVYNAQDHVTAVFENDTALNIAGFTLEIDNNLRTPREVGFTAPQCVTSGKFNYSGTLSLFYRDSTVYARYLAFTTSDMALVLTDDAGNVNVIDMPALKFNDGGRAPSGGANTDITQELSFEGFMNASELRSFRWASIDA